MCVCVRALRTLPSASMGHKQRATHATHSIRMNIFTTVNQLIKSKIKQNNNKKERICHPRTASSRFAVDFFIRRHRRLCRQSSCRRNKGKHDAVQLGNRSDIGIQAKWSLKENSRIDRMTVLYPFYSPSAFEWHSHSLRCPYFLFFPVLRRPSGLFLVSIHIRQCRGSPFARSFHSNVDFSF